METSSLTLAIRTEGIPEAQRGMDGLTNTAGMLEKAFGVVVAAFAAFKMAEWAKDVTLLAARYETLGIAMNTAGLNIGFTSVQMSALQIAMEKTGISMVAARQSLTMMAVAQMDLAKSTELARTAQNVAIVANMNSSEAFETLTKSIQTGMAVTAHHMGLMVNYDKAERTLAASLGKTKEELTDREKVMARTNEVMRVGAGFNGLYEASMTTAGKQLLSMDRYIQNLGTKMGALFGPALSAGVTFFTEALKDMAAWLDKAAKNGSLQSIAAGLGSFTGGTLNAALAPIKLLIQYSDQLKAATIAVGIAAAFAYGNQGIAALGLAIAPTLRMLTLTVFLEAQTLRLAAAQGIGALATAGWSVAMTALLSPMALVAAGLAVLWFATKGIREETERLNAATAAQEQFRMNVQDPVMNMREEARRLRKQREALLADGGTPGAATRQFQIDELVGGVTKGKESSFTPEWMASAKLYATQTVDNKNALQATKDAIEGEAAARKRAEEAAIASLQHRIELMKYESSLYEKNANARDKSADSAAKEDQALQLWIRELDPATAGTAAWVKAQDDLNWALTDGLITQEKYNQLLEVARGKYTEAGQAAEAYTKKIQGDVTRLNQSKGGKDESQYLADLGAAGLDVDIFRQKMERLRLDELRLKAESGSTWAIIGLTVTQSAGRASDALVNWMDNLDGVGRSWRTLGDTVKAVIRDMLIQMQRQIVMAQMMKLANGAGSWFGSLGAGGGGNPTIVGADASGEVPTMANPGSPTAPAALKGGGSVGATSITIYNTGNGAATSSVEGGGQAALGLAKMVKGVVNEWAAEQSRHGGVLAGAR